MSPTDRWWEPRRDGEATSAFLGRVLEQLGAPELAANALLKHYDDYAAPPDVMDGQEIIRLVRDVSRWIGGRERNRWDRQRGKALVEAIKRGEFDGTREEADAWARSPEGQATFAELVRRPDGTVG